jgi:hypothetical protein
MRFMAETPSTWTSLQLAAITLHELFATLQNSGFTEEQALKFMAMLINTSEGSCEPTD